VLHYEALTCGSANRGIRSMLPLASSELAGFDPLVPGKERTAATPEVPENKERVK
jgi:hypothetical protein